jgi:hypothetical protein
MRIKDRGAKPKDLALDLYVWRLQSKKTKEWREPIFIFGPDNALHQLLSSLQELLGQTAQYGKGSRKFRCTRPAEGNVEEYLAQHGYKVKWLETIILKLDLEPSLNGKSFVEGGVVSLYYRAADLRKFISLLSRQLAATTRYPHGAMAPGNLYLSPDWLGAE